ncbi:hypothetical protein CTI12_AA099280 [Artemisia annua]|uniref:Uncharacterized protein n=1 Tax=Artemisia annua TaxID=35608 RepID=A0A2U1PY23_ARTAN|nr:hypothetical protein CTI12_AA099280 [Artemisia annua]
MQRPVPIAVVSAIQVAEQITEDHNACVHKVREELKSDHPDDLQIVVMKQGVWRIKDIIQFMDDHGHEHTIDGAVVTLQCQYGCPTVHANNGCYGNGNGTCRNKLTHGSISNSSSRSAHAKSSNTACSNRSSQSTFSSATDLLILLPTITMAILMGESSSYHNTSLKSRVLSWQYGHLGRVG